MELNSYMWYNESKGRKIFEKDMKIVIYDDFNSDYECSRLNPTLRTFSQMRWGEVNYEDWEFNYTRTKHILGRWLTLITKKFGWTGIEVPVIGQGTWMIEDIGYLQSRTIETLQLGLELGMTHIDTAEMYGDGHTEELVAKAISG